MFKCQRANDEQMPTVGIVLPFYNYAGSKVLVSNLVGCLRGLAATRNIVRDLDLRIVVSEVVLSRSASVASVIGALWPSDVVRIITTESPTIAFHNHTAVNIGFQSLEAPSGPHSGPHSGHLGPRDPIVFCDADIVFQNPLWPRALVDRVQSGIDILQPFGTCHDLNSSRLPVKTRQSFTSYFAERPQERPTEFFHQMSAFHTGYVWAFSVEYLRRSGGLFNRAFNGAGDTTLMMACLRVRLSDLGPTHERYKQLKYLLPDIDEYGASSGLPPVGESQRWAPRVGHMDGVIQHLAHGSTKNRQYAKRHMENQKHGQTLDAFLLPCTDRARPVAFVTPELHNARLFKYFQDRRDDDVD